MVLEQAGHHERPLLSRPDRYVIREDSRALLAQGAPETALSFSGADPVFTRRDENDHASRLEGRMIAEDEVRGRPAGLVEAS